MSYQLSFWVSKATTHHNKREVDVWSRTGKTATGAAVAQEVEWLSANQKVASSIPGLSLAKCWGVPEQDTT